MPVTNQYQLIWRVIFHSVCCSALWRGVKTRSDTGLREVTRQAIIISDSLAQKSATHFRTATTVRQPFHPLSTSRPETVSKSTQMGIPFFLKLQKGQAKTRWLHGGRKSVCSAGTDSVAHPPPLMRILLRD